MGPIGCAFPYSQALFFLSDRIEGIRLLLTHTIQDIRRDCIKGR